MTVQKTSVSGDCQQPPPIGSSPGGTSPSALRTRSRGNSICRPPSVTRLSTLPAPPCGPLDLMAPLRTTQDFPIRLHHRLQDLQPGRDAQAMERFPDTIDHTEDRQRHLDRDGSRAGARQDYEMTVRRRLRLVVPRSLRSGR